MFHIVARYPRGYSLSICGDNSRRRSATTDVVRHDTGLRVGGVRPDYLASLIPVQAAAIRPPPLTRASSRLSPQNCSGLLHQRITRVFRRSTNGQYRRCSRTDTPCMRRRIQTDIAFKSMCTPVCMYVKGPNFILYILIC